MRSVVFSTQTSTSEACGFNNYPEFIDYEDNKNDGEEDYHTEDNKDFREADKHRIHEENIEKEHITKVDKRQPKKRKTSFPSKKYST